MTICHQPVHEKYQLSFPNRLKRRIVLAPLSLVAYKGFRFVRVAARSQKGRQSDDSTTRFHFQVRSRFLSLCMTGFCERLIFFRPEATQGSRNHSQYSPCGTFPPQLHKRSKTNRAAIFPLNRTATQRPSWPEFISEERDHSLISMHFCNANKIRSSNALIMYSLLNLASHLQIFQINHQKTI